MFDVLIKGGSVIDGSGISATITDIAIRGDTIVETGKLGSSLASETIDAKGLFVCPGFIDMHSHSDFNIMADPPGRSKIRQGVTTEICGNCGMSAAPLFGTVKKRRIEELKAFGIPVAWSTLKDFSGVLTGKKLFSNIAPLVGHGNIRGAVVGYENRAPSSFDMRKMENMLEDAMLSGAWGMSSGLIYPPGVYAHRKEIVRLAEIVKNHGGIYASHIRNEGDFLLDAIDEAIETGRASGVSIQISHLKTMRRKNWNKLDRVFEKIERAIDKGVNVSADRYPYTAASTGLDSLLPSWTCIGSRQDVIARLQSKEMREKIFSAVLKSISRDELKDEIIISRVLSQGNSQFEGKTLGETAEIRKQPVKEALFDLLIEEGLSIDAVFFGMSEKNLRKIIKKDYVMIGSDSSVWDSHGQLSAGKPHPRSFGTFPKVIEKFVFRENALRLENAIKKMTGQPAEKTGIADRGFIRKGYKADIVILCRNNIKDNSTYSNPHKYPSGIIRVMVNGKWAVIDAAETDNYPGRLLLKNV